MLQEGLNDSVKKSESNFYLETSIRKQKLIMFQIKCIPFLEK